jgi:hypothetical protein
MTGKERRSTISPDRGDLNLGNVPLVPLAGRSNNLLSLPDLVGGLGSATVGAREEELAWGGGCAMYDMVMLSERSRVMR